jgi:hypothetical protein
MSAAEPLLDAMATSAGAGSRRLEPWMFKVISLNDCVIALS